MAHDVFICHSAKDKAVADAVCGSLEPAGIRCWIAPRDVPPGSQWAGSINNAIRTSRVMVLLYSGNSNISMQVLRELELAAKYEVPILPFRMEDTRPTDSVDYYIGAAQWLDATRPPIENHLDELSKSVRALLQVEPSEEARAARSSEDWEVLEEYTGFDGCENRVKDPRSGIAFILVEPGSFMMGAPAGEGADDERPQHEVRITQPFYLAETETTVAQWRRFVEATGHDNKGEGETDKHPVGDVSWKSATAFCRYYGYRLPTEAEWEYACRAGTTGERYGRVDEIAWHVENSRYQSHPVAEKKPNLWGFYDMLGNLGEWCADAFGSYGENSYRKKVRDDPFVSDGEWRRLRGGSYDSPPTYMRASHRSAAYPRERDTRVGFRCARGL